jgi:hypothetical protein
MPRIRTLKPDHRQHRKVGPLSHLHYRLWVSLILEADDEGRLVFDPAYLKVATYGYRTRMCTSTVREGVTVLTRAGLVRSYRVNGVTYIDFPSWKDHQRINRPTPSKLPAYQDSARVADLNGHGELTESSVKAHGGLTEDSRRAHAGRERKGRELKTIGGLRPPSPRDEEPQDAGPAILDTPSQSAGWDTAPWPSPEALAALYNRLAPDHCPAVETLSEQRRKRARRWLKAFPERAWWEDLFDEYRRSRFLSGRTPPTPGHESFRPDFDWLLSNGRNGTENAVKVHDGAYRELHT